MTEDSVWMEEEEDYQRTDGRDRQTDTAKIRLFSFSNRESRNTLVGKSDLWYESFQKVFLKE